MAGASPWTRRFRRFLAAWACDRSGAVALEYGILLMMIGIALLGMASLTNVADRQNAVFNEISSHLNQ